MTTPDASLVVPVRDEAGNIAPLVAEIRAALGAAAISWELLLVDDGSGDDSWAEISRLAAADPRIQGIRLDRGQGKSAALAAGFARCRGPRIVMLDGDGQDDPAEVPRMLALLDDGAGRGRRVDLVNGWKTPRLDPWHKTMPSRVFNWLVGAATGLWLHDHNCGLKAFRAETIRGVRFTEGMHRFIPVLVAAKGFQVAEMPVHHRPRTRGSSKYGVARFLHGLRDLASVAVGVRGRVRPLALPRRGESRSRVRHGCYAIMATMALAAVLGRIAAVSSVDRIGLEKRLVADAVAKATAAGETVDPAAVREKIDREKRLLRPFLSGNDRSRWLATRALVERGTFAIDEIVVEPGWDTIDAVVHPDASGRLRLYSSKPPLLSVLCAGPYWIARRLTGWTLGDHPFELGRLLMVAYGLAPLAIFMAFTFRLVDRIGRSEWGRLWAAGVAAGGTLLNTFAVVLTNHVPAAACTAASAWLTHRIAVDGLRSWGGFAAAGGTAALAAAFELPALAWLAAVLALLAVADLRRTLTAAVPAACLVAAAALGTNWLAHGSIAPPYAHRTSAEPRPAPPGVTLGEGEAWNPDNWYDYAIRLPNGRLLTSYWRSPQGVDRGEPSPGVYAWHALVGHHGILSLTPAWLLVLPGLALLARRPAGTGRRWSDADASHVSHASPRDDDSAARRRFAAAIATVTLVVLAFYLSRPQLDRNYGGTSSGFRWAFWLAPLWVAAAVPAADRLASSRAGRGLALALLALSVVSVAYPTWSPWTIPWLQQWLAHAGWISGP
jgi:glycosyltransferase involved in cell wall biosynthesis